LPVLPPGLAGVAAVELGCGSGYPSAWLGRRGARPVGVDVSARQLAIARRLQGEFGLRFPLIQADAERVPLDAGWAGLVISEYGASVWCDPCRRIPEVPQLRRGWVLTVTRLASGGLVSCVTGWTPCQTSQAIKHRCTVRLMIDTLGAPWNTALGWI